VRPPIHWYFPLARAAFGQARGRSSSPWRGHSSHYPAGTRGAALFRKRSIAAYTA
jgi:hypothetical protein